MGYQLIDLVHHWKLNESLSLFLTDMSTVAPGWPNPYSSHDVSTDTTVHGNPAADDSEQKQLATRKVTTEIGTIFDKSWS